jgi:hypothetical protein
MAAVAAMHEEVHTDADQKRYQKGYRSENVQTMLNPKKHSRYSEKDTERESRRSA